MNNWSIKNIMGVIPALLTPFEEDESLSEGKLRNLVEHLINSGVNGFYLTGSTGEGFLMNSEERKKAVEIVMDQVKDRVPVIVHVGTIATKEAVELAKHAYKSGAAAISSVPPFYYKFTFDEIYNYYKDISDAAPLPIIVYSIPATTGVDIGVNSIVKLSEIENVKGIKFTSTNHYELGRIREKLGEDFIILSGSDEMCLSGLLMGADGLAGTFFNMIPELFVEIYKDVKEEKIEEARRLLIHANDIIEIFLKYEYYPSIREAMKWMGIDCGRNRRPFKVLNSEESQGLKKELLELKNKKNIKGVRLLEVID